MQFAPSINDCVAGQVNVGAVLSTFVTVKLQELDSPFTSVTVNVTLIFPAPETTVPATGDWVTLCTPQLSLLEAKLV